MSFVSYFEIPVTDMPRAIDFYRFVFHVDFETTEIDGNEMALFPPVEGQTGANGALARGDSYVPSLDGSRIYFSVASIDEVLVRVHARGGEELYPKTSIGDDGYVAEFRDSEGNRIALIAGV